MRLLYSSADNELEFSGNRAEFAYFSEIIEAGKGSLLLTDMTPHPAYAYVLRKITVEQAPQKKVSIEVDLPQSVALIRGDPEWLEVLRDNVRDFGASADVDEHLHVEYFPDHYYLDEQSSALILLMTDDGEIRQSSG